MYYLMGIRSINNEFKSIKNLGIFNPRLNNVYLLKINAISLLTTKEVSTKIIGYK